MRAAATGSTEPERLRQLSGVAHHYGDVTEMVDFAASLDFTKSFLLVCSACHDILPYCFCSAALARSKKNWMTLLMVSSVIAHETSLPHRLLSR